MLCSSDHGFVADDRACLANYLPNLPDPRTTNSRPDIFLHDLENPQQLLPLELDFQYPRPA